MKPKTASEAKTEVFPRLSYTQFSKILKCDLYRYGGKTGFRAFWTCFLKYPGFCYTYHMRLCRYLYKKPFFIVPYIIARILLRHYQFRFGIQIDFRTEIGHGFYIGHFGGIVVSGDTVIGCNVNLSPNTVIGRTNRGNHIGVPRIGNTVYIGPNVNIIGAVTIGDNVAIGAGSVVLHDVTPNTSVAGVPAKPISENGASDYVNFTCNRNANPS